MIMGIEHNFYGKNAHARDGSSQTKVNEKYCAPYIVVNVGVKRKHG